MKRRIKSALLCTALTLVSLAVMRFGNDEGHLPAADYTDSAQAVFFMFDENEVAASAISYASANNIFYLQTQAEAERELSKETLTIESAASRILPPIVTPPDSEVEVFGENS